MAAPGSLLFRLNDATRHHHAVVDRPWLDLLQPNVAVPDYLGVLVRMYGVLAPFESACKYTPGLGRVVDFRQLSRAGFIAQDLLSLGLTPSQVSSIPTTPSVTVFRTISEAVGWLYVIERASLLQDGIREHLVHHIPTVEPACTYLASYEGRSQEHWTAFARLLDAAGAEGASSDEIVDSARVAFEVARGWISHNKTDLRSVG